MRPEEKQIKLKPIVAIVCDDIRIEENGKPILIGIYTGGVQLGGIIPSNHNEVCNWSIKIWILFEVEEAGTASFELQIVGPDPKSVIVGKGAIAVTGKPTVNELIPFSIGPIPLKVWQDGEVRLMFKNDEEDDFQVLRVIPTTFKPQETPSLTAVSSSSASLLPS